MQYKAFGGKYIVRLERGEEVVASLKALCAKEKIRLGAVSGIGATDKAVIGLFNTSDKKYYSRELTGDHEIVSVTGNVSEMNGEVYLHLHAVLADGEQKCFGGHLNSAVISGTFEGVIDVIDGVVDRKLNEEVGLNLLALDR